MSEISRFSHLNPNQTAVITEGETIRFGRLDTDISSLVGWLAGQGVVRGQRIGISLPSLYWAWVARFAALRMGLVQVTLAAERLADQVAAVAPLDFALGEFPDWAAGALARRIIAWQPHGLLPFFQQAGGVAQAVPANVDANERMARCLILTSGTTGRQRVVALDYRMVSARLHLLQGSQCLSEKTRLLSTVGANTMPGFGYTLATWLVGGSVQFAESRDSVPALEFNCMVTTPSELQLLLGLGSAGWVGRGGRRVIVVGGRLPLVVRDQALQRVCAEVVIDYGATETNCTATGSASLLERHPGAIGFTAPGASIEVIDQKGHRQPAGQEGLIRSRTPTTIQGYGADQEVSSTVFRDGWFYPGDLGVQFDDGLLAITGRVAETLNLGGTKIPLLDFEDPLQQVLDLEDGCAIVLKGDSADSLAFLVVCADHVDLRKVMNEIARDLPFKVPFKLLRVAAIPRNTMGKIPRNALSQLYSEAYRKEIARLSKHRSAD